MSTEIKKLYIKLDRYFSFDKKDLIVVSLFKSLVILFAGGLSGVIITDYSSFNSSIIKILIFIALIIIYVFLEYRNLYKQKNFPISILDQLNAKNDLEVLNIQFIRQKKNFEFIDNSITSLNSNTCPISYDSQPNTICSEELKNSLSNILDDFINRTNYFLEIDKSKFTNGIFLNNIFSQNNENEIIINFKDDFDFNKYFLNNVNYDSNNEEKEFSFHLNSSINECISLDKYTCKQISFNKKIYSIVISPIPNICADCPARGAIYAIYEGIESCNCDSNKVLEIHCRLLTNWISKYESCQYNKTEDLNKPTID